MTISVTETSQHIPIAHPECEKEILILLNS